MGRKPTIEECHRLLQGLLQHEVSKFFLNTVDTSRHPDYATIVKKPIDLNTIRKKLDDGVYNADVSLFLEDIELLWKNTYAYNTKHSQQYKYAQFLQQSFERNLAKITRDKTKELKKRPSPAQEESDVCAICKDGGKLLICDGDCLQAFHLKCIGLTSEPKTERWYCDQCRKSKARRIAPKEIRILSTLLPNHMQTPVLQPWFKQLQQTYPTVAAAKNAPFTSELLNNQVKQYDPELRTKLLEIPAVERRKLEESVRQTYMKYDPFWCCWRPAIPKKDFVNVIRKLALEQGIIKEEEDPEAEYVEVVDDVPSETKPPEPPSRPKRSSHKKKKKEHWFDDDDDLWY